MQGTPTASIAPGCPSTPSDASSNIGNRVDITPRASGLGVDLSVEVENNVGGSSCMTSMLAKDSHTAVSCLWHARHTISKIGAAGSESRVISDGKEVIERKKSLNALFSVSRIMHKNTPEHTSETPASMDQYLAIFLIVLNRSSRTFTIV